MDIFKKIAYKAIILIVGIVSFIVAKSFVSETVSEYKSRDMIAKVDSEMQNLIDDVKVSDSEEIPTEQLYQKILEKTAKEFTSMSTKEKFEESTNQFWGFYFINTRARKQFCLDRGVDISLFSDAFKKIHETEFTRASSVYEIRGISPDDLWRVVKKSDSYWDMLELDMNSYVESGVSPKDFCSFLSTSDALALVDEMHYSKRAPQQWKILIETPLSSLR